MDHDTYRSDHPPTTTTRASGRDFSDSVPRGSVLRDSEPVVAPVAPPPTGATAVRPHDERPTGRLDASSRRVVDDPDAPGRHRERRVSGVPAHRFSLGATFLGWAVASFFALLFTAILVGALGGVAVTQGTGGAGIDGNDQPGLNLGDVTALGVAAFIGFLVAQLLAYLIGGYTAGRIAHWDGAKHGAGVPVWAILFGALAFGLAAYVGDAYGIGAYLPRFDVQDITALGVLSVLLTLATMFAGAILGGILGARHDQAHEGDATERGRVRRVRGRPL